MLTRMQRLHATPARTHQWGSQARAASSSGGHPGLFATRRRIPSSESRARISSTAGGHLESRARTRRTRSVG
jgi:hypothetical protein